MMRYLFLGLMFDRESEKEILARSGYAQAQVNQYQWGFIDGLKAAYDIRPDIIASIPMASFPLHSKMLFVKSNSFPSPYGIDYVGYPNFYVIRELVREKLFYKKVKKYIESSEEKITVFVYSMYYPFLKIMRKFKNKYGDKLNYVLIVPDLVGKYTFSYKNKLKQAFHSHNAEKQMAYAKYADSYVLLTEKMREPLGIGNKPYSVIEGFLPHCNFNYGNSREKKTVLYTGSLNPAFGITTLLSAFESIDDPDYRLWICGAGDGQRDVEAAAERDSRIIYKGFLPKSEIADLQTRCDVLINPRPADGEYTKYSFPSKTMEYLLSGSKVVMHRLDGIGEEYYRFIRTIDEHTPEAMARAITAAVADEDFYNARNLEQVEWIRGSKVCREQVAKIRNGLK